MLTTYKTENGTENWNEAQANAVATLMRDCGHAAFMSYTTVESGSYDTDAAVGLSEHLGYDTKVYPHYAYTTAEWLSLIKNELDNGFPVLFTVFVAMKHESLEHAVDVLAELVGDVLRCEVVFIDFVGDERVGDFSPVE